MVQIPEYTRRENAQPMQRGGMNLQLPDALARGANFEPAKKALKLSGELAEAFVAMKDRRDNGIASAFTNQYAKDSTQKILELQQQYQGQNAKRIMPEFQKWRDNYIAEYSTYDPDSAKEGRIYLENEAQNRIAKERLDAANVRDINSLSAYIAKEEETFRVNSLKTSIANGVDAIATSDIQENIMSFADGIVKDTAALYPGQSEAFIKSIANKELDAAVYANVMRDSASNPMASIDRLYDPVLNKNLSPESKEKLDKQLKKSFVDYQAQQIANAQTGRPSSPVGESFYSTHASFFGGDIDSIKAEINKKAEQLKNKMIEEDGKINNAVLNDLTVQLWDAQASNDEQRVGQVLSALSGVPGGVEMATLINDIDIENNDYARLRSMNSYYSMLMLTDPKKFDMVNGSIGPSYEEVRDRLFVYNEKKLNMFGEKDTVIENINHDEYNNILDIKDLRDFPPDEQEEILNAFMNRKRYNSLSEQAKAKSGVDFSGRITEVYKSEYGDPSKNPVLFNRFQYEMSNSIIKHLAANPNSIPTAKDLQQMAKNSLSSVEQKSVYAIFTDIAKKIKYSTNEARDYTTTYQKVRPLIDAKCKGWFRSAEEKVAIDKATNLFIDGRWNEAYNVLVDADLMEKRNFEE